MTIFKTKVLQVVQSIPRGKTMTYGEVAAQSGSPRAARAVGNIMKNNTSVDVPCHKVIKSDGTYGEYNGIRGTKEKLLESERVCIQGRSY